jgi:hypothetical protein
MRSKEQITNLTELELSGLTINFPKTPGPEFHDYRYKLRNALQDNVSGSVASSLNYDDIQRLFYVTVRVFSLPLTLSAARGDGFDCELSKVFYIDPMKCLIAQMDAILALRKHLQARSDLITDLLRAATLDMTYAGSHTSASA